MPLAPEAARLERLHCTLAGSGGRQEQTLDLVGSFSQLAVLLGRSCDVHMAPACSVSGPAAQWLCRCSLLAHTSKLSCIACPAVLGGDGFLVLHCVSRLEPALLMWSGGHCELSPWLAKTTFGFASQVDASGCAALTDQDLAPLAALPLASLNLARCWNFEVTSPTVTAPTAATPVASIVSRLGTSPADEASSQFAAAAAAY